MRVQSIDGTHDAVQLLADGQYNGVIESNPFETLDQSGVGDLMRIGVERGRGVKPDLKVGICGEHGGDPASIAFCEKVGLDYVPVDWLSFRGTYGTSFRAPALFELYLADQTLLDIVCVSLGVRPSVSRYASVTRCSFNSNGTMGSPKACWSRPR